MEKPKILVVEDEIIIAEGICIKLKKLGYDVPARFSTGEEAIKGAEEIQPDLMLMDINLEKAEIDGIEAAKQIQLRFNIPVIYLTAYSDGETLERAKLTEPFGYIIKPFADQELHIVVEMALYKAKIEKKLKESRQWLFTTLNSIGDAVITTDTKSCVSFMNPVAEYLTGWRQEDAAGKPLGDILYIINAETDEQAKDPVISVIKEGITIKLANYILIAKDGTKVPIDDSAAPIRDDRGNVIGAVVVFRDITERKKVEEMLQKAHEELERRVEERTAELSLTNRILKEEIAERKYLEEEKEKLQAQLFQSQKIEAVGRLAGGIAHDFNNLIQIINGFCDVIKYRYYDPEQLCKDLDQIKIAGEKAALLTNQLLAFSRKQIIKTNVINLNNIIQEMNKMLKRLIGEDIEYITILEPELKDVKADHGQIEQIIMNLVVNARDAMPQGGQLTILTGNVIINKEQCSRIPESKPGEYIFISIKDTGVGIPKSIMNLIFEPFYTTKGLGKGTGLGLSTVYGITKQQGGWINVESEPGVGTEFKVYLKAEIEKSKKVVKEKISLQDFQGNSEKILLVEDEAQVREFIRRILTKNGYVIKDASCAQEAIRIFEQEQGKFHMIISDMVLPDQNGLDLIEQLHSKNPEVKILLVTGYSDQKSQWMRIQEEGFMLLQKPFEMFDFLRIIKKMLQSNKMSSEQKKSTKLLENIIS